MSEFQQGKGKGIVVQDSGTSILVAALVGAGIGAAVALLLAPCSGRETRGWLADRSRQIKDKTARAFEQGKQATLRAADEVGRIADEAGTAVDRLTPNGTTGATILHDR